MERAQPAKWKVVQRRETGLLQTIHEDWNEEIARQRFREMVQRIRDGEVRLIDPAGKLVGRHAA